MTVSPKTLKQIAKELTEGTTAMDWTDTPCYLADQIHFAKWDDNVRPDTHPDLWERRQDKAMDAAVEEFYRRGWRKETKE